MFKVVAYEQKYNEQIYNQFIEFVREENFFLELSYEEFSSKLFKSIIPSLGIVPFCVYEK